MIPRRPGSGSSGSDTGRQLWRLSGMGVELASHILAGLLLGWVLDKVFDTGHRWMTIGAIAGAVVGMTEFIRSALKAQRRATRNAYRGPPTMSPPGAKDDSRPAADAGEPNGSPPNAHVDDH